MSSVVVFGGYGTFGSHVTRELVLRGVQVVIAGRSLGQAQAFAKSLGPGQRAVAASVQNRDDCRAALQGQSVAVDCTGPFDGRGSALLESCLEAGCHYVDIADDRAHAARVRSQGERFARGGLVAAYGCSSLPSISGALAHRAAACHSVPPERARLTLFIGNANPKGRGALESFLPNLGRPLAAPQGTIRGYGDREVVPLPKPFGRRAVFNFDSPDYDLLPNQLDVRSVWVKVGFESRLGTTGFAVLAALPFRYGAVTAALLSPFLKYWPQGGSSGGVVMAELFYADGVIQRATLLAPTNGQRMAILPCVLSVMELCAGTTSGGEAMTAYEFLGAEVLLSRLVAQGLVLHDSSSSR